MGFGICNLEFLNTMSRLVHNVRSPRNWDRKPRQTFRQHRVKLGGQARRRANRPPLFLVLLAFLFRGRTLSRLFVFFLVVAVLGATFLTFAIAALSRDLPEPGKLLERSIPISTKIYDREGKTLLYDIHGEVKRTPTSLDKISTYAKNAAIVAEDKDFYRHTGFRFKSMLRAALANVTSFSAAQGGSTITQQFVKNAILTREKTLTRKLKELVLSYRIEKRFSKDEILNMYFNEIPYGSTIYGLEAASQTFFQKSAQDLDLVESALLAALPKAPTRLSPYGNNTDELVGRAKHIIRTMSEEGYVSPKEALSALSQDFLKTIKPRRENILAPHFVLWVKEQLVEKYGEDFVERGGLKVTTSLDWPLQQIAEEEVRKGAEANEKQYKAKNAALVAQDPKTGQILAMIGSRDYFDESIDGNVNVALRPRQPGSSFKPIVYAAAFEKGFTADTMLWDVVTTFKTFPKDYEPHNYDDKEHGLLSMRKALAGSLNIPAVKTIYLTGIDRVLDLAEKLGYTTLQDRSRFGLSLVLGGGEVKLLEHVGAFAALANDGTRLPQTAILRIEDASGRVLQEWQSSEGEQALPTTIVRELISILTDNNSRAFMFGSRSPLILSDRSVAVKTGTTNDWRDGWTLGFTPSLAAGVWAGNNDNTEMKRGSDGVLIAAPIWNAFMSRALKEKPVEEFPRPEARAVVNPILRGQGLDLADPHAELYYLDKDALEAAPPQDQSKDPNFETWETAVRAYAQREGLIAPAVPSIPTPSDQSLLPPTFPQ